MCSGLVVARATWDRGVTVSSLIRGTVLCH